MKQSVIIKLIIFVALALALEGLFFDFYISYELNALSQQRSEESRKSIYGRERASLEDLVETAYSTVQEHYRQSQDVASIKQKTAEDLSTLLEGLASQLRDFKARYENEMPPEALNQALKEMVAAFRFDGGNYIWIQDATPAMIMHPTNPALDGENLQDYTDPTGKKLFVEIAKICKQNGRGVVDYEWPKPGETEAKPKVSYAIMIPELGWILGAGTWIEDVTEKLKQDALAQIASIRLRDNNYFWINSLEPRMVMHPLEPDNDGMLLGGVQDAKGKHFYREIVQVCKESGQGFVEYWKKKPGTDVVAPKLSFVKLFKPWGWVVGMGVYMDEVDASVLAEQKSFNDEVDGLMKRAAIIMTAIALAAVVLIVLFIRRSIMTPLNSLVSYSVKVAGGDLATQISGRFKGELLHLKDSVQTMVASLKTKMDEAEHMSGEARRESERAQEAATRAEAAQKQAERAKSEGMLAAASTMDDIVASLSTASESLSSQGAEINKGASDQKRRLAETATAMEEMNATVLEVARNASMAAENADATQQKAQLGSEVVTEVVRAISQVQEITSNLKNNMTDLDRQAEAIGKILGVINDIADQTNLLALNAAIEAARAGEAGRGFAVVADEVRKLAEKTINATKEVEESIHAIQETTRLNVSATDRVVEVVKDSTTLADDSGNALQEILSISVSTADQVRSIATAAEEQSAASEEITRTIEDMDDLAGRIATGVHESAIAQEELAQLALRLKQLIDTMKKENTLDT
ncbi:MAG: methyl-accepting chemotaxis protein [Desulfovibrionaceae bacterium]